MVFVRDNPPTCIALLLQSRFPKHRQLFPTAEILWLSNASVQRSVERKARALWIVKLAYTMIQLVERLHLEFASLISNRCTCISGGCQRFLWNLVLGALVAELVELFGLSTVLLWIGVEQVLG